MGELTEPSKPKKNSYADKLTAKLFRRKNKKKNQEYVKIHIYNKTFYTKKSGKKKKRRKTASQSSKLNPELEKLLQEATDLYLSKNFEEAVKKLKELIRRAPGLHDPFHMLGLIYQNEYNDVTTANSYYLLAAHLVPTDTDLWQRIGEMSQESGNLDQAIYCFKKCQRNQEGQINEQAVFALAICYIEKKDYENAAKRFLVLFNLHPNDKLIANELSKCFQMVGDLHSSLLVLTAYFNSTLDLEILETILELNVKLSLYEDCLKILNDICTTNNIEANQLPLEHLVYYVISCLNLDKPVDQELNLLYNSQINVKYAFLIANHLCPNHLELSVSWFKKAYSLIFSSDQIDVPTTLKISKCITMDNNHHEFLVKVLRTALESNPNNSELLINLADILLQQGNINEAEELLSKLTLNDLDKIKDIPEYVFQTKKPISEEERHEMFNKLNSEIEEIEMEYLSDPRTRVYPCLLSYGKTISLDKTKLNEWVDTYLKVIKDCELDTERAMQRLSKTKITRASQLNNFNNNLSRDENSIFIKIESKKSSLNKSYSFLKVKKELNLKSAEDILGWAGYERLIFTATVFMCLCNRVKEAVEVLELISNNKKKYKSNLDSAERKSLIKTVEKIIFKCSSFGGLFKIAVTSARNEFLKDPVNGSLEGYARILGTGKMAHSALLPLSSSNEKDALLENRYSYKAWVTRQLLQYPDNFQLLMLGGHFCSISGNWSYAKHEYQRAYQKEQNDSLASLCLATSYFNSLNNKITDNVNKALVLGMTFLQRYVELRMRRAHQLGLPETCTLVFKAEGMYNIARAYHFLNLFNLAVPLYENCLQLVSSIKDTDISSDPEVQCPCILCDYSRMPIRPMPSSCKGFSPASFISNHVKLEIQRV
ncbi:transcription factor, putative [Theileria annulata]|uniref:Transcription factor, putative n=1 Tax=Theileria annulata TaxID=5874 RepID=Q4U9Y4_THEAN|nr:transcription factor, putative [Theileria annulata]CAI76369.1 transcription factor, putative [Theileria annulata]|eukprot:XP_952994.1 transcription factor, putative [Theileria annulata]